MMINVKSLLAGLQYLRSKVLQYASQTADCASGGVQLRGGAIVPSAVTSSTASKKRSPTCQVKSSQVESSQVRSGQVQPSQVERIEGALAHLADLIALCQCGLAVGVVDDNDDRVRAEGAEPPHDCCLRGRVERREDLIQE